MKHNLGPIAGMIRHVGVRCNGWMIEKLPDTSIIDALFSKRDRVWLEATTKLGVVGFRYSAPGWLQQIGKLLERGDHLQECRAITIIHQVDDKVGVKSPSGVLILACNDGRGGISAARISIEVSGSSNKLRLAVREATESSMGHECWQQIVSALKQAKPHESNHVVEPPQIAEHAPNAHEISQEEAVAQILAGSAPPKQVVLEDSEEVKDLFNKRS